MKKYNRKDIFDILNSYNFDKNEYIVISGGSMVAHGIKDTTRDIDISVSKKLYDELLNNYNCNLEWHDDKNNVDIYYIDDVINFSTNFYNKETEIIDGIRFQTLDSIINMKKEFNRVKDIEDIKKINAYLKEHNVKES